MLTKPAASSLLHEEHKVCKNNDFCVFTFCFPSNTTMPSAAQIAFDPRKVLDSPDFKVLLPEEVQQTKPTDNVCLKLAFWSNFWQGFKG